MKFLGKNMGKIIEKLFQRMRGLKSVEGLTYVETIHPYLGLAADLLIATQKQDGSWEGDVLITSFAIRALHSFSMSIKNQENVYREAINRGYDYLRERFVDLLDRILSKKFLYANLDRIAQEFESSLHTLFNMKTSLRNVEIEKVYYSFKKIVEATLHYLVALRNIDLICSLLNCYLFLQPVSEKDLEDFLRLLSFVINEVLSQDVRPSDAIMILYTLVNLLNSDLAKLLESAWLSIVKKRTDEWKNEGLERSLNKLARKYIREDLDVKSLCYGLLFMNKMQIIGASELKRGLVERLFNWLIGRGLQRQLLAHGESLKQIPLYELSLVLWSLSTSEYAKVVIFPAFERKRVLDALEWYKGVQEKRLRIVDNKVYLILKALVTILIPILIMIILILTYFLLPDYGGLLGIVLGGVSLCFLIGRKLRKKLFK